MTRLDVRNSKKGEEATDDGEDFVRNIATFRPADEESGFLIARSDSPRWDSVRLYITSIVFLLVKVAMLTVVVMVVVNVVIGILVGEIGHVVERRGKNVEWNSKTEIG